MLSSLDVFLTAYLAESGDLGLRFAPLCGRVCFHGQGMHLVVVHLVAQCGVNLLVAANESQPFKLFGHNHGLPVAAVTTHFQVLARKSGGNHGLNLFCSHLKLFQ